LTAPIIKPFLGGQWLHCKNGQVCGTQGKQLGLGLGHMAAAQPCKAVHNVNSLQCPKKFATYPRTPSGLASGKHVNLFKLIIIHFFLHPNQQDALLHRHHQSLSVSTNVNPELTGGVTAAAGRGGRDSFQQCTRHCLHVSLPSAHDRWTQLPGKMNVEVCNRRTSGHSSLRLLRSNELLNECWKLQEMGVKSTTKMW